MRIADILAGKGHAVQVIRDDAPLPVAAMMMTEAQIGALIVVDADGAVMGLVSEREVTAAFARAPAAASLRHVSDAMVDIPLAALPDDGILAITAEATRLRARHVPVFEAGRLIGIVSIGDLLKARLTEKAQENDVLRDLARWREAA